MIPLMKTAFLREQETREALARFILTAPRLSMDQQCFDFEAEFARHEERPYAVLFNSGASANLALLQALKNLGRLSDGDRVGFSALTWSTNVMPIIQLGMKPVAIDINKETLNVMSWSLSETIQKFGIKAFFATNVLGLLGDLDKIASICRDNDVLLLEDNCESLGSSLSSGRAGSFGLGATFSFYVAHHMSTIEGGMVVTSDKDLSDMLRIVRANGWDRNLPPETRTRLRTEHHLDDVAAAYAFYDLGFNLRPTEITGFLGRQQMAFLDESFAAREHNFTLLDRVVRQNDDMIPLNRSHVQHLSSFAFPMLFKSPEIKARYVQRFMAKGIEIRPVIAGNMQRQPFYSRYVTDLVELPETDFVHYNGFYCGNYPDLTQDDLDAISGALAK